MDSPLWEPAVADAVDSLLGTKGFIYRISAGEIYTQDICE
jgi:hypothetical protein